MSREQRTWVCLSPEVFRRIERTASWGQLAVRDGARIVINPQQPRRLPRWCGMRREQRNWVFLSREVFRRIERAASWGQLAVRDGARIVINPQQPRRLVRWCEISREQRTWVFLSLKVFRRIERAASWGQLAVRRVRIPQIRAGKLLKTVHHSSTS